GLGSMGDVQFRWDNLIQYSVAFRLEKRDPALLLNPNTDDGDRNFDSGVISNRLDVLSQLDVSKDDYGFDVSVAAWYDSIYHGRNDNNSPSTYNLAPTMHGEFADAVESLHGGRIEFVNAFIHGRTELFGMPFSFRVGRHTLLWGESLFFPDNG